MGHKKIILLFGPTTSGKSKLASDIAKELNGEIINADSMQVYKEVKVLSARPYNKNIKHHLYGFVSAKENFSVGSWHKLASKKIKELILKTAILLGQLILWELQLMILPLNNTTPSLIVIKKLYFLTLEKLKMVI